MCQANSLCIYSSDTQKVKIAKQRRELDKEAKGLVNKMNLEAECVRKF